MSLDELTQTRQELETLHLKLKADAEAKREELERFKEDTLWRLNSLSDHSIELARGERAAVDADLEQDRLEWEKRVALWVSRLSKEIFDDAFLDSLAELAFQTLLPSLSESGVPKESDLS